MYIRKSYELRSGIGVIIDLLPSIQELIKLNLKKISDL
jgi:hypothetical protein